MDSSSSGKGLVLAVGLGPGAVDMMTPMAAKAIERSEVVAGYSRYVERIEPLLRGKRLIATGMTKERERCEAALDEAAKGRVVAMVCSGDAGVYGMAGLLLELVESVPGYAGIEIESVPGVTAATAAAAVLGAPLMNDFAIISLSDLMTPAELIVKRLEAVAGADMVVALYNPRSHSRRELMDKALEIFMGKLGPDGVFGLVRNAFGLGQTSLCGKLSELPKEQVDMSSLLIIGNSQTFISSTGKMLTRRGYLQKNG